MSAQRIKVYGSFLIASLWITSAAGVPPSFASPASPLNSKKPATTQKTSSRPASKTRLVRQQPARNSSLSPTLKAASSLQSNASGSSSQIQNEVSRPLARSTTLSPAPTMQTGVSGLSSQAAAMSTHLSTSSSPQGSSRLKGFWSARLRQLRTEDPSNQRSLTEFRLLSDLHYYVLPEVHFRLKPKFTYANGFTQTQDEERPNTSRWGVLEASVRSEPSPYFEGALGALNQEETHPFILLYEQAFPSVRLQMQTHRENPWVVALVAQTGIPTSNSLSTETKEFEPTPSFSSASLNFKAVKTTVQGLLQAGYYEYQNLPMSVATQSSLRGNTTRVTSGTDAIFTYGYKGPFAQLQANAPLSRSFSVGGTVEWIQNNQAPSSLNQGTFSEIRTEIIATQNVSVTPYYNYYRVEPDAAVAIFNADWITTNRVGYFGGLKLAYKKALQLNFAIGESDAVFSSPFQQKDKTWFLKLETFDVAI